jgi:membrane protease subunit HflK
MQGRDPRVINIKDMTPPKISPGVVGVVLLVIVGLFLAWSMFFTIAPEEVGVILRFGKFTGELKEPGLNFKLPWPIDSLEKVPVQRQLKEEFGFETERVGVRGGTRYSPANFDEVSLMLTGDLNVADVEWIAQYRISDPYKYLFKVRNKRETFRDMNEAVMREVIGDRSVTEVFTVGRAEIADQVKLGLQELCEQYEIGIRVDQIVLQNAIPPEPVQPSFNEVNQAQQEKEQTINEARKDFNSIIPKARGQAQQTIQSAEGYATDRVNRSRGDAAAYEALLKAYRQAPEVTRRRIYLETMGKIYPKVQRKVILDKDLKGVLPLLSLDGEVKK